MNRPYFRYPLYIFFICLPFRFCLSLSQPDCFLLKAVPAVRLCGLETLSQPDCFLLKAVPAVRLCGLETLSQPDCFLLKAVPAVRLCGLETLSQPDCFLLKAVPAVRLCGLETLSQPDCFLLKAVPAVRLCGLETLSQPDCFLLKAVPAVRLCGLETRLLPRVRQTLLRETELKIYVSEQFLCCAVLCFDSSWYPICDLIIMTFKNWTAVCLSSFHFFTSLDYLFKFRFRFL